MNKKRLLQKLVLFERCFKRSKYRSIVETAMKLFHKGQYDLCEKEVNKLPTAEQLLETLIQKLQGKSVYRTLKKIQEGKVDNKVLALKGLSSLLTHTLIEIEKGRSEYKLLIPTIIEKIGEISYDIY